MSVDSSGKQPYGFDFFETITAIHFPLKGGYVLVTVTATATAVGIIAPPCPTVFLNLGKNETLIQRSDACVKKLTPGHTTTSQIFFVWNDIAPFPTADNYQNSMGIIDVHGLIEYAQQFARVVNTNNGGFRPAPDPLGTGFFPSATIADQYAAVWNGNFGGAQFLTYLDPNAQATGPVGYRNVRSAVINIPVTVDPFGTTTLTGKYLIKVPKEKTTFTAAVITSANGNSHLVANGYHGKVPASIAKVNPSGFDTQDGDIFNGPGTYTVTSVVAGSASHQINTVTVKGGGGGPGTN